MKKTSSFLLVLVLFAFCNNPPNKNLQADSGDDNITTVRSDDLLMNAAIAKAKETFNKFDSAFKNGHFDTSQFLIKVRFNTDSGGEHIWAHSLAFENGSYYGIISEDAVATNKVKHGDRIKITMDNLSDWMYNDNGILRGGYTIKVHRNQMSVQEQAAFDSSFSLRIVD